MSNHNQLDGKLGWPLLIASEKKVGYAQLK